MVRRWICRSAVIVLAAVLAACGGSSTVSPTSPSVPLAPERPATDPQPTPTPAPTPAPVPVPTIRLTRFVAFGDSFTEGVTAPNAFDLVMSTGDEYWLKVGMWLGQRYSSQTISMIGAGKAGEWAEDGILRLPSVLSATRPEVLLLMEGVNDLNYYGDRGVVRIAETVEKMILMARGAGAAVVVATLPPQRPGGARAGAPGAVESFNALMRRMAGERGAALADVYAALAQDLSLIGADGLHPTSAGYERIAQVFFEAIRTNFEDPAPSRPSRNSLQ